MDGDQNTPIMNQGQGPVEPKSTGPVIGIVIIILIIVLGGLYFWGQRADQNIMEETQNAELEMTQSESDDLTSIEADLNSADFDGLGAEVEVIEAENAQ